MSNSIFSTWRKQKSFELPIVEGFQSKKIVSLKSKRKSYIGKITKTIYRITDLIDKQEDFSIIDSCNEFLENYIKNITNLTSETTKVKQITLFFKRNLIVVRNRNSELSK